MVRKGAKVRVARGRKVPVGTVGIVIWSGEGTYGPRVGIKDDNDPDGEPLWTSASNVDVIVEGTGPDNQREVEAPKNPNADLDQAGLGVGTDEDKDATIEALQAEVAALSERLAISEDDRKEAEGKLGALHVERDELRTKLGAFRERVAVSEANEIALASRVAPILDESYLAKVAKFAAEQVESAIKIALRTKLTPEAPKAAPVVTENGTRKLELDAAPASIPSDATRAKVVADAKASRDAAHEVAVKTALETKAEITTGTVMRILDEATKPPEKAPQSPAKAPEAPKKSGGLKKCAACNRFVIGNHACKK